MRIRCERCATVYELDEKRLPARGALVKCTRCQHVFRAAPPGALPQPDPSLAAAAGPPPASAEGAPPPPPPPSEDRTAVFGFSRSADSERTASFASAPAPAPAPVGGEPTAARAGSRPSAPRTAAVSPAPATRPARWPWILAAFVLLCAAIVAIWLGTRRRPESAAERLAPLEEMLARDDRASVESVAEGAGRAGGAEGAALRALALLWLAADAGDEAAPFQARVAAMEMRLREEEATRAPGWQLRREEIGVRLALVRREMAPLEERARRLLSDARTAEEGARAGGASRIALLRTRAVRQAIVPDPGLEATVREAATLDAGDPWVEMARAFASVRRGDPEVRGLESVAARRPTLLRARVLLARALHTTGREADALRILDAVLAENGEHERAKAWKAEILAPPEATVSRVMVSGSPPVERAGGYLPRLKPRS